MQDLRFRAGWQSESGLAHNGTALLPLKTMPQLPLQKDSYKCMRIEANQQNKPSRDCWKITT